MLNESDLRCPNCNEGNLQFHKEAIACSNIQCIHAQPQHYFKKYESTPVLISEKSLDTVFDHSKLRGAVKRQTNTLFLSLRKLLIGENAITRKNCTHFIELAKKNRESKENKLKILVIGGGEVGSGSDNLYNDELDLTCGDIYLSEHTDLICDGHYLPFNDGVFDGVWIQAVLEHVADPQKVVSEIHRVLSSHGIVYSEVPFIQQVHEGAYDFTRYTPVGHRYLFKAFTSASCGPLKSAEDGLAWSIRYFIWSLTRSRFIAKIFGVLSILVLKPFSYLLSQNGAFDSCSGSFFLGEKAKESITQKQALEYYKGLM